MSNVTSGVKAIGNSYGVTHFASGYYTGDGVAGNIAVACGFTPRYVELVDVTANKRFEWWEGLPATNTLLTTGAADGVAADTNSVIVTNLTVATATEMAFPAPNTQTADLGTTGTTTVTFESPNQANTRLYFTAGASGALCNVNTNLYYWHAWG